MHQFSAIEEHIQVAIGKPFKMTSSHSLAGGDINCAFRLQGADDSYFIKLNEVDLFSMFQAEFAGLTELQQSKTVRVPTPIVCGKTEHHAFIVLEYIAFGRSSKNSDRKLGEQLAQLHRIPQPFFGWHCNNTIGSTLQHNTPSQNWLDFWREQRLGFQLQLAAKKGFGGALQRNGERLLSDMSTLFICFQPKSSLLHGDLWGGNFAVDQMGVPVLFDPACYYGDREADLAMTELFGGFSLDFYAAYRDFYPVEAGYDLRKKFYNLYHILNHVNLFGPGYLHQAENIIEELLAAIKR